MTRTYVRRALRLVSFATVAGLGVLVSPQAAGAAELGGYEISARADALHVEVYEPSIPVPGEPQGDIGIGHTKSVGSFGPSTRGTASALWPGDVLGDGFGVFAQQFGGDPKTTYPDQVNAFYPNKPNSAKQEFGSGSGNGEFATASDKTTNSTVQLAGLATPGATSGSTSGTPSLPTLPGLGSLLPNTSTSTSAAPSPAATPAAASPVPVGSGLGALVQSGAIASSSVITYLSDKVVSTSHAKLADVALLGGVIKIKTIDVTTQATSDGKAATSSGTATIAGVSIAGQDIGIDLKGVKLGPSGAKVPDLKSPINTLLKQTGISIDILPGNRTQDGALASARQVGLVLTVDTTVVKAALQDPGSKLARLLGPIFDKIPQNDKYSKMFVSALYGLLNLGPRIVINVGDVETKASAAQAYVFETPAYGSVNSPTLNPNPGVSTGGGSSVGDSLGNIGATPQDVSAATDAGGDAAPLGGFGNPTQLRPAAKALPPLGKIPAGFILGALALAAGIGWVLQAWGGPFMAASRVGAAFCSMGLDSDLPNLREGH